MTSKEKLIVFTDLDGTLLDDNYSYEKSLEGIKILKKYKIPIVICTSKTRKEIEFYRKRLRIKDPFISENGGGIFIPKSYFPFSFSYTRATKDYYLIRLGTPYKELVKVIKKLKKNYSIKSFYEMTPKELAQDSGLSLHQAKLAKTRDFDEPFILLDKEKEKALIKDVKKTGLKITKGGRYYHIMGNNDKGKAVKILLNLYKKLYSDYKIVSIALGDSQNDFPMLDVVDKGYLVRKKKGYASDKYLKAYGINGEGFTKVIKKEVKKWLKAQKQKDYSKKA